jgi:hypothetical protein
MNFMDLPDVLIDLVFFFVMASSSGTNGVFFENLETLDFDMCTDPLSACGHILGTSRRVKKFYYDCNHPDMYRVIGMALDRTETRLTELFFRHNDYYIDTDLRLMRDMFPSMLKHAPTLEVITILGTTRTILGTTRT